MIACLIVAILLSRLLIGQINDQSTVVNRCWKLFFTLSMTRGCTGAIFLNTVCGGALEPAGVPRTLEQVRLDRHGRYRKQASYCKQLILQHKICRQQTATESDATHPRQRTHANTQHLDLTMPTVG